jgi:putative ABC transport system permease protein
VTVLASTPAADWRLAGVLLIFVAVAVGVSRAAGLGVAREQVVAALRAVVQLAVVSTVIGAVLGSLGLSFGFVALMFLVASFSASRRLLVPVRHQVAWVGLAVACGAGPVVGLCLGSGVIPMNGAGVIPIAGIVIGNAMTAVAASGRRAFDELRAQRGQYEAALALGLQEPEAVRLVVQPTAREALLPTLDQTRTVGLVTLPGAFIGVLLGGGTAVEAGAAQLLVLIGLLAAQALSAAAMHQLIATGLVYRDGLEPERRRFAR